MLIRHYIKVTQKLKQKKPKGGICVRIIKNHSHPNEAHCQ